MLILDFNDSELRIADGDKILARAPGFAVLDRGEFILGTAAAAQSRLNPRASYQNFWEQLDQQPLNRAAGRAQSHADIGYFHLQALWKEACAKASSTPDGVIVVVPSQYGAQRLSLLLGIARACAIPVQGLVDSAVLAVSAQATLPCRYLDISQHRVYRSDVDAQGGLQLADELSQQGLVWCYEQCIKWIATQFMAETRFDPLHEAASEQRLFDELPQWLGGFAQADRLSLSLPAGQRQHRIEVSRAQLLEQLEPLYRAVETAVQGGSGAVLLSHRFATLPGLAERLNAGLMTDTASLVSAANRAADIVSNADSPLWIKQLQAREATSVEVAEASIASAPPLQTATHLLHRHCAYPLEASGLLLGAAPQVRANDCDAAFVVLEGGGALLKRSNDQQSLSINGEVLQGKEMALQLGDTVQCGAEQYQLIYLQDSR